MALAAVISAALGTSQSGGRARWLCHAAREVLDVDDQGRPRRSGGRGA